MHDFEKIAVRLAQAYFDDPSKSPTDLVVEEARLQKLNSQQILRLARSTSRNIFTLKRAAKHKLADRDYDFALADADDAIARLGLEAPEPGDAIVHTDKTAGEAAYPDFESTDFTKRASLSADIVKEAFEDTRYDGIGTRGGVAPAPVPAFRRGELFPEVTRYEEAKELASTHEKLAQEVHDAEETWNEEIAAIERQLTRNQLDFDALEKSATVHFGDACAMELDALRRSLGYKDGQPKAAGWAEFVMAPLLPQAVSLKRAADAREQYTGLKQKLDVLEGFMREVGYRASC